MRRRRVDLRRDVGTGRRLAGGLRELGLETRRPGGDRRPPTATATSRSTRRCPAPGWCSCRSTSATPTAELRYALEDSGTRVLFAGPRRAPVSPTCVEHVIDLDDGYEQLLAGARAGRLPGRRRHRARSRRPLLHRRHDGRCQGRDAHPPQPGRQRLPLPGVLRVRRPTRAGWSWRRCSTPPARSPCWPRCGTPAGTWCCGAFDPARALDLIDVARG